MNETVFCEGSEFNLIRHSEISAGRESLLLLHGLGDCGLAFQEVFEDKKFAEFNIVVPDMTGYGKSSRSPEKNYSLDAYAKRLWKIIDEINVYDLTVIGHSMGGDIAALLCDSDKRNRLKKFISIEGNLTRFDLFISQEAVRASDAGCFEHWFYEDFMASKVLEEWSAKYPSCRRYYSSLRLCHTDAFLANARELCARNRSIEGKHGSELGQIYISLTIPKIFCYGTKSLSAGTLDFLKQYKLEHHAFENAFHWPMIDNRKDFYSFLYEYVKR